MNGNELSMNGGVNKISRYSRYCVVFDDFSHSKPPKPKVFNGKMMSTKAMLKSHKNTMKRNERTFNQANGIE